MTQQNEHNTQPAIKAETRTKNWITLAGLVALIVVLFFVTIIKISGQS